MKSIEMATGSEVEACRTCGIFFLTSSNYLRHIFSGEPEMINIRKELEFWQIQLNENDRFPQYICTVCLMEFRKIFKFQSACLDTQQQLCQLYTIQQENMKKMKIKTEIFESTDIVKQEPVIRDIEDNDNVCAFIYVDDLSDSEYEDANVVSTPFKVPHLPIKEEIIEQAKVPEDNNVNFNGLETPKMSVTSLTDTALGSPQDFNGFEENDIANDNEVGGIQCHLCMHVSENQQQHRQHLLRIHESKPMECHICGKQFKSGTTTTRFKYHLKWHRINKHIKCPQCGFYCASRDVLNEHTRAVHTRSACKICGKHLLPKKMRAHMEQHEKAQTKDRSECPYCVSDFATVEECDQHIMLAHSMDISEISSSNVLFAVPMTGLASNPPNSTDLTNSETASSSGNTTTTSISYSPEGLQLDNLNRDVSSPAAEEAEDEEEEHLLTEDITEANLMDDTAYDNNENDNDDDEDHEFIETNSTLAFEDEMQFTCVECPQSFAKVEQLIAHSETHKQKFECHVCAKKFELKFSLNRHMKKHKN